MAENFWKGRRVFVTGHTGFKGSWLCRFLAHFGADVTGYSLEPPTNPSLFDLAGLAQTVHHHIGDVRDAKHLCEVMLEAQPEVVLHLAAQPIVLEGYRDPRGTYETNVMGTVNLLDAVRQCPSVRSVLNVTTDKVYRNNEAPWGFRETDVLDGLDPYSNSKSCSELVTHCYAISYFRAPSSAAISTARAGNVIGGGDFSPDRIIPDCIRAMEKGEPIGVRNPGSRRPYQHVLEPLALYLEIAKRQFEDRTLQGNYNIGPDEQDCLTTGELVDLFCAIWGEGATWKSLAQANAPHEAGCLRLDTSLVKATFGWRPRWHIAECMEMVCRFAKTHLAGGDLRAEMDAEISTFLGD